MAAGNVRQEFSSRGLACDCIAWYPWRLGPDYPKPFNYSQRLGFDSMMFLYLGGDVEAQINWPFSHIDRLTEVGMATGATSDFGETLDTYDVEGSLPGQHWSAYRSTRTRKEKATEKHLATLLTKLLEPTVTVDELAKKFQWYYNSPHETRPRPWIRFRQKKCDTSR